MASKWILFMSAFVLLMTRMVSSTGDVKDMETENNHHHAKAPAHAPIYAPLHAPAKDPIHHTRAPAHAPAYAPLLPPAKAPIHHHPIAPPKFPAPSPATPPPHGCVAQCASYCKPVSPKRPCMKTCTMCCAKCKCVPAGLTKCSNWNSVEIHGHLLKCP